MVDGPDAHGGGSADERRVGDGAGEGDPAQLGAAVGESGRGLVAHQQALVEVDGGQVAEAGDDDVEEFVVASTGYLFPGTKITDEALVLVVREPKAGLDLVADVAARNQRLVDWKRVAGVIRWDREFPRTASMKIKRDALAAEIRAELDARAVVKLGET